MSDQKTEITEWLGKSVLGYTLNSGFSEANQATIEKVIQHLHARLPDVIWPMPPKALHITLMDWLAPLVDYGEDKKELFERIRQQYDAAFEEILKDQSKITVHFDKIGVYPGAVIVEGHDDGSYQRIRNEFLKKIPLLPGTKLPPKIIHSSICRFTKEVDLEIVAKALKSQSVSFDQTIEGFRLAEERLGALIDFEVIKVYKLK